MAGAGLGSTASVIASTVAAIAADEMLHDSVLVGAAVSAGTVGAAIGTALLADVMTRRGRRVGLVLGYVIGCMGGLLAALAVLLSIFPLLLLGMLLVGLTSSSTQLSRYASADMARPEHRASAIGIVVWAATAGAILGPVLLPLTAGMADSVGLAQTSGPFLATALAAGTAGLAVLWKLRPDPDGLAVGIEGEAVRGAGGPPSASEAWDFSLPAILRRPPVIVALAAMVVGQVVMVVIMAMTPVHMSHHGHDLASIGIVISAHVLGMFALSPLSGRLADRFGAPATILLGCAVLAVAGIMAALAPAEGGSLLLVALFLLGYGWNLGYVAGSSLLTSALDERERTRAQGYTDSLVWGSSAVASVSAGVILAAAGYAALGILGTLILAVPVVAVLAARTHLAEAARSPG